jgi:hypothetical protein
LRGVLKQCVRAINFSRTHECVSCEVDNAMALHGAVAGLSFYVAHVGVPPAVDASLVRKVHEAFRAMSHDAQRMPTEVQLRAQAWDVPEEVAAQVLQQRGTGGADDDVGDDEGIEPMCEPPARSFAEAARDDDGDAGETVVAASAASNV